MNKGNSDSHLKCTSGEQTQCTNKSVSEDLTNDELLAGALQREFSSHYVNQNSIQRRCNSEDGSREFVLDFESDVEDDGVNWDKVEDEVDNIEKQLPMCQRGYKSGKKHSVVLNKNKNGYKLLAFPPAGHMTNDAKNRNFKNFKTISVYEQNKARQKENKKCSKELFPTYSAYCKSKIDSYALFVIKRMMHKQILLRVNDILHIGCYGVYFQADCNQLYPNKVLPKTCVVKVFKDVPSSFPKSSRENFKIWGQKEAMGLKKLHGIVPCSQLISHKEHIVTMSFIGEMYQPAPKISDVQFEPKEHGALYKEIIDAMKAMYRKGKLIHGSLTEDNILWHHKKCHFIGFHHSLEPHEEKAFYYLHLDCEQISYFFRWLTNFSNFVLTPDDLFQYITGCSYIKKSSLIESEQRKHMEKIAK